MAFGFRCVSPYNRSDLELVQLDTTAAYINDPLKYTGDETSSGRPCVTAAAAGDALAGVLIDVLYYTRGTAVSDITMFNNYHTSGAVCYALMMPASNRDAEYECTFNGDPAANVVQSNADMDTYAAGSTVSGISGCSLSTTVGSGSAQFRIKRFADDPNNTVSGNLSRVIVSI